MNEYYQIDSSVTVCRPYEVHRGEPLSKYYTDYKRNKRYTREEINQVIADLFLEDWCPEGEMYIEYHFWKHWDTEHGPTMGPYQTINIKSK